MTSLRVICGLGPSVRSPGYAYAAGSIPELAMRPRILRKDALL